MSCKSVPVVKLESLKRFKLFFPWLQSFPTYLENSENRKTTQEFLQCL